jgi:hypothetical protein
MVVRRVAPVSFAKVAGIIYAVLGFCFGLLFTLASLAGAFASERAGAPGLGLLLGVGAVIMLPIFYGVLGFVVSLIGAALYNAAAGWVGGVEVEMQ